MTILSDSLDGGIGRFVERMGPTSIERRVEYAIPNRRADEVLWITLWVSEDKYRCSINREFLITKYYSNFESLFSEGLAHFISEIKGSFLRDVILLNLNFFVKLESSPVIICDVDYEFIWPEP